MRTLRTAFNGGQISQDAESRSDLGSYSRSCRKIKNFIVDVVGSLHKRLGFRYLCDIFAVGNVRLIGMSVSDNLSFVLEFTNLKLRILDSDGNLVKDSSGNIIILTTPWTYTDIRSIQVAHKISALFVVCADKAPHRVFRRTINEWSVDTITFNWGEKPSPWGTTEAPGYPSATTFHENRLWFGGSPGYPQKIWVSSENDYIDMNPGPNSGDAFDREIASDGLNAITWFKTNRDLILGTLNEEFLIKSSDGKAISNTNISILSQTSYGSKRIKPLSIDQSTLFIQGSGDKVREFKYSFADDSFSAKNLSILNPLQDDEIIEMVYQQDPDSIIWMCTTEGKLMGLTYDQSEQVKAWHEHDVDGKVRSMTVIPDPNTSSDMLFIAVEREGVTTIEVLTRSSRRNSRNSYHLDSNISIPYGGLDYIGPVETIGQPSIWNNTFSSLARYAGKNISVVSGGKLIGNIGVPTNSTDTVTSRNSLNNRTLSITNYVLHISGSNIFELGIGLQYECELQTTPIELGEPTRAFTGAKTQLVSANFKMSNSYFGFYFGVGENLTGHGLPNPNTVNNSYTGDLRLMSSVGEDAGIIIKTTVPLSFGLSQISIVYKITESSI